MVNCRRHRSWPLSLAYVAIALAVAWLARRGELFCSLHLLAVVVQRPGAGAASHLMRNRMKVVQGAAPCSGVAPIGHACLVIRCNRCCTCPVGEPLR
jgi:hypothetical protein